MASWPSSANRCVLAYATGTIFSVFDVFGGLGVGGGLVLTYCGFMFDYLQSVPRESFFHWYMVPRVVLIDDSGGVIYENTVL